MERLKTLNIDDVITSKITVLRKTSNCVYLSNGTYMHKYDFNKLLKDRQENRQIHFVIENKKYEDFKKLIVRRKEQISALEDEYLKLLRNDVLDKIQALIEDKKEAEDKPNAEMYQRWYEEEQKVTSMLRERILSHAKEIYFDLPRLLQSFDYTNLSSRKFIIQEGENGKYKFRFDPYSLLSNYHSAISEAFSGQGYHTINGGHFRIINGVVYLYGRSGDYGVYNNDIAVKAAKELFGDIPVESRPDKNWSELWADPNALPF